MNYRLLFPASLSLLLSSCYSVSVASQYLALIGKGQALHRVDQATEEEQLLFQRVRSIKRFSEQELGLRATQNYSRYVRLDRSYLTAVVSAAPPLGFEDYLWNYPFVGKLPYRGYFQVALAKKEAARLEQQGYDVWVRPVDAFSSLGYVRDPLFSYMAGYSEARLANLIIHESFHATLYVRGDSAFNESLANLVGNYGSELYMDKYGDMDEQENTGDVQLSVIGQDRKQFRRLVLALKEELAAIYKDASLPQERALHAKGEAITRWQQQFQPSQYGQLFGSDGYEHIAELPINNAYLALFSLYEDPDNFLEDLYQQYLRQEGNKLSALRDFIALSRRLGKKHGRKTRQALREHAKSLGQ